ncbi:hypothetical protein PHYBOEH_000169 [Phytophthora boehmeriae]|uniref:Uncharacterized protein n=1 Tax=Phytophthora boehmeriae TaxID=109152 RepID=A0A8T1X699_9STRA|nr:hypothetical protein PHYBOEH_000169 [Phytophthora boehmeriae]
MQTRGTTTKALLKQTCQLSDTPDEDGTSANSDKENTINAVSKTSKAGQKTKPKADKKRPAKRQRVGSSSTPLDAKSQETPPTFTFKAANTAFRKRKQRKHQRQQEEDEKNKKRIKDLVAYFKNLDEQKLETA